jgi:uncharacterized protein (UPF0548 family)
MGEAVNEAARRALLNWTMFDVGWIRLNGSEGSVQDGQVYGVVSQLLQVKVQCVAFVERVLDRRREDGARLTVVCRAARAHTVIGSECFTVRIDRRTSEVAYCIRSSSRIVPALWAASPAIRAAQRRFGRDSGSAMRLAVERDMGVGEVGTCGS